jgi:hypothetical protein
MEKWRYSLIHSYLSGLNGRVSRATLSLRAAFTATDVPVINYIDSKMYGGSVVYLHAFLIWTLDGEKSAARPGCLSPEEMAPDT